MIFLCTLTNKCRPHARRNNSSDTAEEQQALNQMTKPVSPYLEFSKQEYCIRPIPKKKKKRNKSKIKPLVGSAHRVPHVIVCDEQRADEESVLTLPESLEEEREDYPSDEDGGILLPATHILSPHYISSVEEIYSLEHYSA